MVFTFNEDPQPKTQLGSTTDLAALKALIDNSPVGFKWQYVSAPAARAWTNNVITDAGILVVYKPSETMIMCELHSLTPQDPLGILRKKSSVWEDAFLFRNTTTNGGGNKCLISFPRIERKGVAA